MNHVLKKNIWISTGNKIAHQGMIIFMENKKKVFSFTLLGKIKFSFYLNMTDGIVMPSKWFSFLVWKSINFMQHQQQKYWWKWNVISKISIDFVYSFNKFELIKLDI